MALVPAPSRAGYCGDSLVTRSSVPVAEIPASVPLPCSAGLAALVHVETRFGICLSTQVLPSSQYREISVRVRSCAVLEANLHTQSLLDSLLFKKFSLAIN